ncbi:proline--tRNA ligase [Patescibacteria group bacterium]|nr:proline--tRNA ligase [Patescibacteria group bacterium]MBU4512898.1 proline--tRNA ligase [Patescibacteria group bacterium]MCG2692612.1 proline--tRNA ligase [Candidatus Parcubacteria bacterium]
MLQSQLFYKTTKEPPKDAEIASHKFLVQAGFIDQVAAGIYSLLPLAFRVYKKIENIIREEMNKAEGQEISMPTLQPKTLWQETGRWETIDPPLFIIQDRHKKELCLGPTHEEVITKLVRERVNSYKDLPLYLYQIQNKFRNEMRSTGGLLRVREFMMKDLYSFHADEKDLDKYYKVMLQSYKNVYQRCGVEAVAVEASSGSIGGEESQEFMVLAKDGEDSIKLCPKCGYAGNVEVVKAEVCPKCDAVLDEKKCIEAGHIFKLGTMYSKKMGAKFIDKDGKEKPIHMGCYGIGLGRLLATIVEASHDEKGIIWPKNVAPFRAHLIGLDLEKAKDIYNKLKKQNIDVLFDDREEVSAGEKFVEADLIGIPIRLVVSKKTGENVEWKERGSKKTKILGVDEVTSKLQK